MTQKALIAPNMPIYDMNWNQIGDRIAQLEPVGQDFPVAPPLFWVDCDDNINTYDFYWDNGAFITPIPPQPKPPTPPAPPSEPQAGPTVVA